MRGEYIMEQKQKIREFIESNFIVEDEDVEFSDSDNFFALGFVNSLFAMKLVTFLEQEFNIVVDNDDLDIKNFNTINNIIALITRKCGDQMPVH